MCECYKLDSGIGCIDRRVNKWQADCLLLSEELPLDYGEALCMTLPSSCLYGLRYFILVHQKSSVCTNTREAEKTIMVDIEKLSAMLSCGRATARKIGEQAEAKIYIGKSALYSVDRARKYMCLV